MLQRPTQISGITAILPVQYSDSGAASLCFPSRPRVFAAQAKGIFKSLRGLFLRRAPRPFAVHAASSLTFGEPRPSLVTLRQALRACPLRLRWSLRHSLARSRTPSASGEGGVPNSSPSRPRTLLGATEASTDQHVSEATFFKCHPSDVRLRAFEVPTVGQNKS